LGKVKITETILRDAHQSLVATRMGIHDMVPILEKLDQVGYNSLEAWGGATFDSCMRFLNEDPWERLRVIRKRVKKTKLQMLLRGQNLLGYKNGQFISNVERALCNIPLKILKKVADVLDIHPDELRDAILKDQEVTLNNFLRAGSKKDGVQESAVSLESAKEYTTQFNEAALKMTGTSHS
jgi:transcriptional regulator with XRE-family HTH domain